MFKFLRKTALWILLSPLALGFLGAASNQLVLNVNNDTFPVRISPARLALLVEGAKQELDVSGAVIQGDVMVLPDGKIMLDKTHCVMTSKTHLNWLADIIDLQSETESVGDIMLDLGSWLWTFAPFVWGFEIIRRLKQE
jgi:hypothetical protein